MAVLLGMVFAGFVGVIAGMGCVAMRGMGMMRALFVIAVFMMLGRFAMVMRGALVMISGFGVMVGALMCHGRVPRCWGEAFSATAAA